jgi:hypothetical protein
MNCMVWTMSVAAGASAAMAAGSRLARVGCKHHKQLVVPALLCCCSNKLKGHTAKAGCAQRPRGLVCRNISTYVWHSTQVCSTAHTCVLLCSACIGAHPCTIGFQMRGPAVVLAAGPHVIPHPST